MDKLIQYIEGRMKRYGHVSGTQALSSVYYKFKNCVIRVSDHIKYGMDSVNTIDYNFIIQPNDTYIFIAAPKHNLPENTTKMFLKIVTLEDAKRFIRSTHEMAIMLDEMTDIYSPENWNLCNSQSNTEKMLTWDEFFDTYVKGKNDAQALQIINKIDVVCTGSINKGNYETKLPLMKSLYEKMSETQYNTLIQKVK